MQSYRSLQSLSIYSVCQGRSLRRKLGAIVFKKNIMSNLIGRRVVTVSNTVSIFNLPCRVVVLAASLNIFYLSGEITALEIDVNV